MEKNFFFKIEENTENTLEYLNESLIMLDQSISFIIIDDIVPILDEKCQLQSVFVIDECALYRKQTLGWSKAVLNRDVLFLIKSRMVLCFFQYQMKVICYLLEDILQNIIPNYKTIFDNVSLKLKTVYEHYLFSDKHHIDLHQTKQIEWSNIINTANINTKFNLDEMQNDSLHIVSDRQIEFVSTQDIFISDFHYQAVSCIQQNEYKTIYLITKYDEFFLIQVTHFLKKTY